MSKVKQIEILIECAKRNLYDPKTRAEACADLYHLESELGALKKLERQGNLQ